MKHTVEETTLANGSEGIIIHVPGVEVVRLLVEFRAGYDLNDWGTYELPHVMEHMMFTNKTYPKPRQFHREVEKNGAFNNAYTNSSSLEYDYECAAFEAERIAKLLAIQITEPTFPEAELKTELGNVADELNNNLSSPSHVTAYNLHQAATGVPTYQTRIDQLQGVTSESLQSHFGQTHTARNMRFILAGDTDFTPLLDSLDTGLPAGERLELPYHPTRHLPDPVVEVRDIPQIYYFLFSVLDRRFSYRELIATRILVSLLSDGFSSTLFGTARERGLVYGLSMGASIDPWESVFTFGGTVSPAQAGRFFRLAHTEINKVLQGKVSKRQFEATKQLLRGHRARQYQRLSNLISYYDSYFTTGYEPFDYYDQLLDEITLPEAVAAFNELLGNGTWGMSFTGDISEDSAAKYQQTLSPLFIDKR